uniref:Uncharacterized protein n=1 Tax=Physcomitrium patens TaxID=3218 RepID=A0A2K1IAB7_PHYPA|nr:hypothetical protein PHYPA_030795 [Physcomitrium patens]
MPLKSFLRTRKQTLVKYYTLTITTKVEMQKKGFLPSAATARHTSSRCTTPVSVNACGKILTQYTEMIEIYLFKQS